MQHNYDLRQGSRSTAGLLQQEKICFPYSPFDICKRAIGYHTQLQAEYSGDKLTTKMEFFGKKTQ